MPVFPFTRALIWAKGSPVSRRSEPTSFWRSVRRPARLAYSGVPGSSTSTGGAGGVATATRAAAGSGSPNRFICGATSADSGTNAGRSSSSSGRGSAGEVLVLVVEAVLAEGIDAACDAHLVLDGRRHLAQPGVGGQVEPRVLLGAAG